MHGNVKRTDMPSAARMSASAARDHGVGFEHDDTMLRGALGWSGYDGRAEIVTPYFGASGTGQLDAVFPVTPQPGAHIPATRASATAG